MNTLQISEILERAIDIEDARFEGVFPRDLLPRLFRSYPACVVVNADSSDKPGSHWIALYFISPTHCELFDSYAHDHNFYNLPLHNHRSIVRNHIQVQALDSNVCGQHCIYFLCLRSMGFTMKTIQHQLSNSNLRGNDHRVTKFVYNLVRRPIPLHLNKSLTPLHILQTSLNNHHFY